MLLIAFQIEFHKRYRSICLDQLSIDSLVLVGSVIGVDSGEGGVVIPVGSVEGATVVSVGWGAGVSVVGTVPGTGVFLGPGVDEGEIGVNKSGANGVNVVGVPVPASGHACKVIGNCRQLSFATQTFKSNEVCWAPRQRRMRCPFSSWALKQVTPVFVSATLKNTWLDMSSTACASSFTQN
jgi:hypothetical protein